MENIARKYKDIAEFISKKIILEDAVVSDLENDLSVNQVVFRTFENRLKKNHLPVYLVFAISVIVFTSLLQIYVMLLAMYFAYLYVKAQGLLMRSFASKYGYEFVSEVASIEGKTGSIFSAGHSQKMLNLISGRYLDNDIEIFNYKYTVGYGKNSHTYNYTIFELDFPAELPDLFLQAKWGENFSSNIKNGKELRLEGDFSKSFTLTVREQFEIEALQILTPDFMEVLKDRFNYLSIEFVENKILIYENKWVDKFSELSKIHDLVKLTIEHINPVIKSVGESVSALEAKYDK